MKVYLISLAAGVLVGAIYGLLNVRSPAPPVIALVGLLGILLGEQIVPVGKQMLAGVAARSALLHSQNVSHVFGPLPGHNTVAANSKAAAKDLTR